MTNTNAKIRNMNCEIHGGYESELQEQFQGNPAWSGCPNCQFDALHSDDPEVRAKGLFQRNARSVNTALLDSGIPLRFRPATLENYRTDFSPDQHGVLAKCKEYADNFKTNWAMGKSMFLLGTMGTGKTHLGCAIIQQVLRSEAMAGAVARYVSASEVIRSVKRTFDNKDTSESQVMASLQMPDLLVVDEIGAQIGTDFERQVLFEVLNGRYSALLPTILISNLNLDQVRTYIGDRVVDRMCDAGGEVVLFRWPSVRGEV